MNIKRNIIKNTVSQLGGRLVSIIASVIILALITRYLGKEGYGQYSFITAFILLFATISDWGTNIISIREASKKKKDKDRIFASILIFRLFLSFFVLFLANLIIRLNKSWLAMVRPFTVASLVLLFVSLKTSFSIIFQTLLRHDRGALSEAISSIVFCLAIVIVLLIKGGLSEIMAAWVFSVFVDVLISFYFTSRLIKIKVYFDREVVAWIFKESLPMGALFVVFYIYNRIDVLILEHFKGDAAVGIYGLAYKIYGNLVLFAAFLMNSVLPIISEGYKSRKIKFIKNLYNLAFGALLLCGACVVVFFLIFSPTIVKFLAGREFLESAQALRILIFAILFAYLNHLTGYSLIAFGRQTFSFIIGVVALFFNVLANWFFIPLFSWKAAAFITVLTECLVFVLSSIVVFNVLKTIPNPFSIINSLKSFIPSNKEFFKKRFKQI